MEKGIRALMAEMARNTSVYMFRADGEHLLKLLDHHRALAAALLEELKNERGDRAVGLYALGYREGREEGARRAAEAIRRRAARFVRVQDAARWEEAAHVAERAGEQEFDSLEGG